MKDFSDAIGAQTPIDDINRDKIREYARMLFDERRLAATTVKRRIATVKVMFRWCEREQLLVASPFHRFDLSIRLPTRLPRTLSPHEMKMLLRAAENRVRAARSAERYPPTLMHFVIVALFTTGLRVGELVSARLGDVSVSEAAIRVRGKGNRERTVYLPGRQAFTILVRFCAARKTIASRQDVLLVAVDGAAMSSQDVRKQLRSLAAVAGIERRVTPHMLRHYVPLPTM